MLYLSFVVILISFQQEIIAIHDSDRCTSIATGFGAMIDNSLITTHNADCMECDFRISHVPRADWPVNSDRPIYSIRSSYPRYVESPEANIHGPDYLLSEVDTSFHNWTLSQPYFSIPQVAHTYGYTLGAYGIQNEKQVSIGESTCGAVFFARPTFAGGQAAMHMPALTEIALERCDTARCAIQLMGDLANRHGFYGSEWDSDRVSAQSESGEALTVSDPTESWVFHILPDDTGASAVWVAQRVPDGHITAVANQFVITEVNFSDPRNFAFSSNLLAVAQRSGLWSNATSPHVPFNFLKVFALNIQSSSYQATRRIWRVFTLAAPSLLPVFSPYSDSFGTFGFGADGKSPYPFSVRPDQPLTVSDVMTMNRDQYEGTAFDMTKGLDAGPFGDPVRFRPVFTRSDPLGGVTQEQFSGGLQHNRPISLHRTAYSTIALARPDIPDSIGAVTWVAQYAPHHSVFVPVYASCNSTPHSLRNASLHQYKKHSAFWVHSVTGNYLSRWYRATIGDVVEVQAELEGAAMAQQAVLEASLLATLRRNNDSAHPQDKSDLVTSQLSAFQEAVAVGVVTRWWALFWQSVVRYRDMYQVRDTHTDNIGDNMEFIAVPRVWYEAVGYWGPPFTPPPPGDDSGSLSTGTIAAPDRIYPINVPSQQSQEAYKAKYPNGIGAPYSWVRPLTALPDSNNPSAQPTTISSSSHAGSNDTRRESLAIVNTMFVVVLGVLVGLVVGIVLAPLLPQWEVARRRGQYYQVIK